MQIPGFIDPGLESARETVSHSERIRVTAVSLTGLIAALGIFLRVTFSPRGFGSGDFPWVALGLVIGFILWELLALRAVRRRLERGEGLTWLWAVLNCVIEGVLPFAIALTVILDTSANPFVMISGPVVLGSLLLIMLSLLRLNPVLSVVTGSSAILAYLALVIWVHARFAAETWFEHEVPTAFFPISVGLLAGGSTMTVVISVQARSWLEQAWAAAERLRDQEAVEREIQLAAEVQEALLPRAYPIGGVLEVAARSRPALKLGGDFYDWMQLPSDRTLLCLADVTGHGAASAILGAEARAYLRSTARESDRLEDILERTESMVGRDLSGGRFVTMFLAMLDDRTGAFEYVSAGQGPLYLVRSGGSIEELVVARPPLGIPSTGDPRAEIASDRLLPGDCLVVVSDGVLDRVDPSGESYGEARLTALLKSAAGLTAPDMVEAIRDSNDAFACGEAATDDASILVVSHSS